MAHCIGKQFSEFLRLDTDHRIQHRCCCCCWVTSVVSDSVQPQRRQPTRMPRPWDSPGKNTGVGCHFLLQCMKVKIESEVAQSCPTLSDPTVCSLPGSSIHGIFQAMLVYSIPQLPPGLAAHIWINFLSPGSLSWCFIEGYLLPHSCSEVGAENQLGYN